MDKRTRPPNMRSSPSCSPSLKILEQTKLESPLTGNRTLTVRTFRSSNRLRVQQKLIHFHYNVLFPPRHPFSRGWFCFYSICLTIANRVILKCMFTLNRRGQYCETMGV